MGPINFPSGTQIITFLILILLMGVGVCYLLIYLFSSDELETKEKLEPIRVEIFTVDDVSDTTYVYKID